MDKGLEDVVPAHFLRSSPRKPLTQQHIEHQGSVQTGKLIISVPPELEEDSPMKRIRRGSSDVLSNIRQHLEQL